MKALKKGDIFDVWTFRDDSLTPEKVKVQFDGGSGVSEVSTTKRKGIYRSYNGNWHSSLKSLLDSTLKDVVERRRYVANVIHSHLGEAKELNVKEKTLKKLLKGHSKLDPQSTSTPDKQQS